MNKIIQTNNLDASEDNLNKKAALLGVASLNKAPKNIDNAIINMIPEDVARKNKIAVFDVAENVMKVAMVDPQDITALNMLRFIAEKEKKELDIYLVYKEVLDNLLVFYTGPAEMIEAAVKSFAEDIKFDEGIDLTVKKKSNEQALREAPVAKLVEVIVSHAIEGHASDIHIEPMGKEYRVRFRVDGILHVSLTIPKEIGPVVISRIKILSNLKIDEKRKPQDGRFQLSHKGNPIDFRISTLPVIDGEKVVMRILDKDIGVNNIESMGLIGSALKNTQTSMQETYGMILMTGPTGSGKSTTLYAMLQALNDNERNIITLEDPIEYNIEGLNQSQINPEIGYTFASGLRTILRQDPNIIMVGEIRDGETAELAVHAALTGHLMFSTLHTNTAIGSISRMIDMGIEPFLLASSIRLVMAQRLVRRICEKCKTEFELSEYMRKLIMEEIKHISKDELTKYGVDLAKKIKFFKGKGCDACNGTGLKGRLAIFEVVQLTDGMKNIIIEKKGNEILMMDERNKAGFLTIRQDGILKVLRGETTIEEIERVTENNIMLEEVIC
ncbi:MAG: Type IV pilus assembly protein PilB [Candidatus Moranbacteria bacterium GW2011_GWA2_39_41]|nr:MAG: Type IV pilus assembly protein PilB [Candidatus Moranbacteria bacterium GW2011_GWA2_39_41]